jgi:signal transduction histidine kinase
LEEKLYDSLEQLKKAEKEKQKYVMAVMHEIKSPLSAMQSYIEIILDKYVGPISKIVEDKLLRAKIRGRDAIELTNNILKISRLRLLDEIATEKVDLQPLLLSIYKKQKVHIKEKDIKLDILDKRKSKDNINGDTFLLEIALSNLIGNAIKYTGREGKILVTLYSDDKNTCIKISDTGIGIPKNDIQNIFKDFYRASNIKEKMIEGAGLGLSIVKQIIERHGGKISVESPSELASENKPGTCFTINIPLAKL